MSTGDGSHKVVTFICCLLCIFKDIEACQNIILQIVDPVRLKIDVWSQIIYSMLQERTEYDKFTIVAMETLMLAQSHFDLISSQVGHSLFL